MTRKVEISHRTIIFTAVFFASLWFLYYIREILLQFFVALLIMTILNPFVSRLEKLKIPRALSILVAYLISLGLIGVAVAGIIPPLIDQSSAIVNNVPRYVEAIGATGPWGDQILNNVVSEMGKLPGQFARATVSFFSNLLEVVTVLIFAFYVLLSRNKLDTQLGSFLGESGKKELQKILDLLEKKLGGWVVGQFTLMILVGTSTYIGLTLIGIPYSLSLGILAGLFEVIPYIGPLLAAVPAVIIGLGISPIMGLAAASLSFLIQQLENSVFVPKVMERSTGVSPVITLLALAVGFKIAGIVGVIISVPVVLALQILSKEYLLKR
jgi:predicted PurR-regulated permease PerM